MEAAAPPPLETIVSAPAEQISTTSVATTGVATTAPVSAPARPADRPAATAPHALEADLDTATAPDALEVATSDPIGALLDYQGSGNAPAAAGEAFPVIPRPRPTDRPVASLGHAVDPLEDMIGQMIMIGFSGASSDDAWPRLLVSQIASGQIGGIMYTRKNVAGRAAVQAMNRQFQAAAGDRPLFISVDQEGGRIERLTQAVGFREIPSHQSVAQSMSVEGAEALYRDLALDLRDWGFNLNFGPVVDLNINPGNPIIGSLGRAFARDADAVAAYGAAFVRGHHQAGVLTAAKHFPGHGSSAGDTHHGFVDVSRTWSESELEPYRRLIATGEIDLVMLSHISLDRLGSDAPATLAPGTMPLLRNQLGFAGVVISDDMEMGAISKEYSLEQAVIGAVEAGNDILIYSNFQNPRPQLPPQIIAILKQRALADPAFRAKIEAAYGRIMKLKSRLRTTAPRDNGAAATAPTTVADGERRFVVPDLDRLTAPSPN